MDNYDYKSNSHKSKELEKEREERNVPKVVKGVAKVREESGFRKFVGSFISDDASKVGSYVLTSVIIPGLVKILTDSLKDSVDMFFKGSTSRGSRDSGNYPGNYVSYNNYSNRGSNNNSNHSSLTKVHNPTDITLPSRRDAEAVLDQMKDCIQRYGFVTIADLYDSVGLTSSYTDVKYGWSDLRNADIARDGEGWYIKFPKAYPLDR